MPRGPSFLDVAQVPWVPVVPSLLVVALADLADRLEVMDLLSLRHTRQGLHMAVAEWGSLVSGAVSWLGLFNGARYMVQ